jgi:Glycosyltransferase
MSLFKVAIILPDNRDEFGRYGEPAPIFGTAPTALLAGFSQIPEIEVHAVSCLRAPAIKPERIAPNVFYHGVWVPRWGFLKTGYFPATWQIRKLLRRLRPNIVHGQGTERFASLAAVRSGFRNILTIHGNMRQVARALQAKPFSFHDLTARLETVALRRTDGVICLTRYSREQVQDLSRKTWLVSNAVNEDFLKVNRTLEKPPTVLCVANVTKYKCQNELIRSLDTLAGEISFRLVFLGAVEDGDPYGDEFLSLVRARKWCEHHGFKTGNALRDKFSTADMLILPSREDNCPMVILEAMAAGVPVAASSIGGIPDLVEHERSGLLFDPVDPASMRETVRRLLTNPTEAKELAERARQQVLEQNTPLVIARKHLSIYQELANS